MNGKRRYYTKEEKEFLIREIPGKTSKEILKLFNNKFPPIDKNKLRFFMRNNKITSGVDTTFKKGQIPWNKDKKGCMGSNGHSFKKGHIPHNTLPIGTEIIDADGYLKVKVANPSKWKFKHRMVWEKVNGPIPKDKIVIFKDKNRQNISIDNLIMISKAELAILNKNKLIFENKELTETGVAVAKLIDKVYKRKKTSKDVPKQINNNIKREKNQ